MHPSLRQTWQESGGAKTRLFHHAHALSCARRLLDHARDAHGQALHVTRGEIDQGGEQRLTRGVVAVATQEPGREAAHHRMTVEPAEFLTPALPDCSAKLGSRLRALSQIESPDRRGGAVHAEDRAQFVLRAKSIEHVDHGREGPRVHVGELDRDFLVAVGTRESVDDECTLGQALARLARELLRTPALRCARDRPGKERHHELPEREQVAASARSAEDLAQPTGVTCCERLADHALQQMDRIATTLVGGAPTRLEGDHTLARLEALDEAASGVHEHVQ